MTGRPFRRLLAIVLGATLAACRSHPGPYVARARSALGGVFSVGAWGVDSTSLARAVGQAVDSVQRIDSLLSGDRATSEITRLNRSAGRGPQPVSGPFVAVLQPALSVARASAGAFDPTGKDFRGVQLDSVGGTVQLRAGLTIDLGGVAPGHALDRALLALRGVADSAVLGIGGLLLVVTGGSPAGPGRNVGIPDPDNTLQTLAQLRLPSGTWAIGTASLADVDPIQDPRSGQPAVRARSVTTVAKGGLLAQVWSRAFFVLGCDSALALAPRVGVGLLCIDQRTRWSADLDGRVALTMDSAGTALAPVPGRAPAAAPAANGSRTPPSSDSSH
jgi:thiamine biosynthesis lipoprotein